MRGKTLSNFLVCFVDQRVFYTQSHSALLYIGGWEISGVDEESGRETEKWSEQRAKYEAGGRNHVRVRACLKLKLFTCSRRNTPVQYGVIN